MVGLRKVTRALVGASLLLGGFAVVAQPASADHLECGATVTESVTLDSDIGPCAGDGLVVAASNVTVNLNGFRIFAATTLQDDGTLANSAGDNAGIRIRPGAGGLTTGVTIIRGTVEGFDAGIAIFGGGNNLVRNMTIQNNINDQIPSADPDADNPCDLGDGIAMLNSSDNDIINNRLVRNGPLGGITAIENSDRNYIAGNTLADHNLRATGPGGCGNLNQNEGVRIEGPGADDNIVENNTVTNSGLAGIGLHGYVCTAARGDEVEDPNTGSIVRGNRVSNGEQNGISFLQQGPADVVCPAFQATIARNTSSNNATSGLFVARNSFNNEIRDNVFNNNGLNGIRLNDFTMGNVFTNVGPSLLDVVTPDRAPFVESTADVPGDFRVLSGSGSGDVTGELVPIDIVFTEVGGVNTNEANTSTSGCEQGDYDAAGFQAGDVALLQRGTCTFIDKIALAVANGASAIVLFNEGQTGRTTDAFGSTTAVPIPVVSTTFAVGVELTNLTTDGAVTIQAVTNTINEPFVVPAPFDNRIVRNTATGNVEFDAYDGTFDPPCDNNIWNANTFGTVNQPCVANGGTGVVPPPPPAP